MAAKGLEGVVVAQTKISRIDGQLGRLIYHGYDIRDLAAKVTFEEVAYLFWYGKLPTRAELDDLLNLMAGLRPLPAEVVAMLRELPRESDPMDALRTGVSALGAGLLLKPPDRTQVIQLTAQMPLLVATFDRWRRDADPLVPLEHLDTASNYLYMLTGKEPTPVQAHALNAYLVILADHGMNASTFAARVVASTWSDLYSSIAAAVGALKGPLHGGAPSRVLDMIQAIGTRENAEPWMRAALQRGERLMGFGHRVYKTTDPRAELLRDLAQQVAGPEFAALARHVEETGLRLLHEDKPDHRLFTNVEFYSSVLLHAVGIPKDLFTTTFAISRTAGWTAHVLEQVADNRLIRPNADYIGPEPRPVPPIEERT